MVLPLKAVRKQAKNSRFRLQNKRTNYPFALGPSVCRPYGRQATAVSWNALFAVPGYGRFFMSGPNTKRSVLMNKQTGFTLIELLVVVLIIGILAGVALPQYQNAVLKARTTEAIVQLKHIRDMQREYALANGAPATTWNDLGIDNFAGETYSSYKDFTYGLRPFGGGEMQAVYNKNPRFAIQMYVYDDRVVCNAAKDDVAANEWCKKYSPTQQVCLDEPSYWCYPL